MAVRSIAMTPLAPKLVAPYAMGPWSAGSMVFAAFLLVPLGAGVALEGLAAGFASGFGRLRPKVKDQLFGGLALAGVPALYLALASVVRAVRFVGLRRGCVLLHYRAQLSNPALGPDPATNAAAAEAIPADGRLYREDRRKHVLRKIGAVLGGIMDLISMFSPGPPGGGSDARLTHPRHGQFGWKLFWGLVLVGIGALVFLHNRDKPGYGPAAAAFVAIYLLWLVPSLWRSIALRRVDRAWRSGLRELCARAGVPVPEGPDTENYKHD